MAIQAKQSSWSLILLLVVAGGLWLKEQMARPDAVGGVVQTAEGWERIEGCRWIPHDRNDGDSFHVRFPDGREEQIRLFFVDAPESARRSYGGGRSNHERISYQAKAFGIDDDAAVEVGRMAKKKVESWLGDGDFVVVTRWEDPFGDRRFSALVELDSGEWLHEKLVKEGLVRIYTKGTVMPDGTSIEEQEKHLRNLEKAARAHGVGGWSSREIHQVR
ncbi:thermonuclease family protein [Haloferula rosea]|uniref:Thermonuclease family protein n=1 Tax=Haloferula rosea TaxID=490093 RepID=A0A934RFN6_9BACT|nr:thermonuclease family protein [Haloferula rosea]MBK1828642.1 thermonuclease family protein [Haloferula rosea]